MATLDISFKPERAHLRKPKRGVIAERVVPQSVSGRYRRLKWIALIVCLAVYYVLPFIRWTRGPGQPDQAVLFDFERGRLYFFFIEIWPQEVYYLTGMLILATLVLDLDQRRRGPGLVRLFLPADRLDRPVPARRAPGRGRPPRAPEEAWGAAHRRGASSRSGSSMRSGI